MTRTTLLLVGWFSACAVLSEGDLASTAWAADDPLHLPLGERQLFLDDYVLESTENLARTLHQPVKRGAVIRPDRPWETVLQTRSAPAWDEQAKKYRLWLITSNFGSAIAGGTTYAESTDGLHWTKPNLRQFEVDGSLENNYISLDPDLRWGDNAIENVVYDPDDPKPERRYKGFLGTSGRQPIVSPDGIHWKKLAAPKLPSQDESNLSYDRTSGIFIATLKQRGPYGRSHALATSKDFVTWTKPELVFHADDEDQVRAKENIKARLANPKLRQPIYNDPADYNADIYNFGVFRYEGLYVGLPAVYHAVGKRPEGNTDGFHLIQLASSRDLKHWKRLGDRQPFIGPSEVGTGAYDTMQLLPPSSPVEHGDELWFYYTGIKYRHVPEGVDSDLGAICLAVLRRDGFLSLDAGTEPGVLVTKPFVLEAANLYVNVEAPEGAIKAQVLDGAGAVLATSKEITGDQMGAVFAWETGDLEGLDGQTVRLRFRLRAASFYSFWLTD